MHSPTAIRELTRALVAHPSISPDPEGEGRCAELLRRHFHPYLEHGSWLTTDGRPALWALLPGRSARTVVLLGHYDTVGVSEFATLPGGQRLAFDPDELRRALMARRIDGHDPVDPRAAADLDEEARAPGTWMFGRGALDMKSGLAAAVGAIDALAAASDREGGVLFIATPDEEHESAGMQTAAAGLERLRRERGLDLIGVVNLDYSLEPAAYVGVMGKVQVGCYVIGRLTHVGAPFDGIDALQLAAQVVSRVTRSSQLVDVWGDRSGPPPVALKLDDFRRRYSIETAVEAVVEFNLIHFARPLEVTLETLCQEVGAALDEARLDMAALAKRSGHASAGRLLEGVRATVVTYAELAARARSRDAAAAAAVERESAAAGDARALTRACVSGLAAIAGMPAPAAVLHLLPPFYPSAKPGSGPVVEALSRVLAAEPDVRTHAFYPFITDASYVAWREDPVEQLASQFPALGRAYQLPHQAARLLDLDVVNLGPWGRDPHGLYERVHAQYAFERLPAWIEQIVREAWRIG